MHNQCALCNELESNIRRLNDELKSKQLIIDILTQDMIARNEYDSNHSNMNRQWSEVVRGMASNTKKRIPNPASFLSENKFAVLQDRCEENDKSECYKANTSGNARQSMIPTQSQPMSSRVTTRGKTQVFKDPREM